MTLFLPTTRDFDSIKAAMLEQVPVLAPTLTNLNEGELGVALISLVSGAVELLGYYQDRYTEEAYLPTARLRRSVQNLTRLVDYRLARPTAARTTLRFSLTNPATAPLLIPKYTVVKTAEDVRFTTKQDVTIYTGQSSVEVEAYQGSLVPERFTGTGVDPQEIRLGRPNVADNFLEVSVGDVAWTEDRPTTSLSLDTVYAVSTDENEYATLRFSRYLGNIPPQNSRIVAYYLETLGEKGNIGVGVVTGIVKLGSGDPIPADLTVVNTTVAAGGRVREGVEEARVAAPRALRTLNRAVTVGDFVDLLESVTGVAKVQAINHNGYVEIYVAPKGGGDLYLMPPVGGLAGVSEGGGAIAPGDYACALTVEDEFGETTWWEYVPSTRIQDGNLYTFTVAGPGSASVEIDWTLADPSKVRAVNIYVGPTESTMRRVQRLDQTALVAALVSENPSSYYYVISDLPLSGAPLMPTVNTTGVRAQAGSESLRNMLEAFLEERRLICTVFALFNPTYLPVNITATVRVYDNYQRAAVEGEVRRVVTDFFSFENQQFGLDLFLSDLYQLFMQVAGVRSVVFAAPTGDVTVADGVIPKLGMLNLTMGGGVV
jgi:hypothetical protein